MRASTMQARAEDASPEVFNPGAWYAEGAPATTHIKPAPAGGCATLYKVYTDMGGESWTNQTGWSTGSDKPSSSMGCCSWHGVACKGDLITGLDLADNRLNGALSPALFQIPGLDRLILKLNSISGALPDTFDALPKLKLFDVSSNFIAGPIPPSLTSHASLQSIHLSDNQFSGVAEFSGSSVTNIFVNSNDFTGLGVKHQDKLSRVIANDNKMKGALPDFSAAENLQIFSVANNSFTGDLFNLLPLKALQRFDIRNNEITGALPDVSTFIHLKHKVT